MRRQLVSLTIAGLAIATTASARRRHRQRRDVCDAAPTVAVQRVSLAVPAVRDEAAMVLVGTALIGWAPRCAAPPESFRGPAAAYGPHRCRSRTTAEARRASAVFHFLMFDDCHPLSCSCVIMKSVHSRCSSALAAQALPATLELVARPRRGTGGDSRRRRRRSAGGARSREGRRRHRAGERRHVSPGTSSCPRRPATATPSCGPRRPPACPTPSARIDPAQSGKLAKIQSPNGSPALRTAPGSPSLAPDAARVRTQRPRPSGDILVLGDASPAQSSEPGHAARSRRRSLLHPWRSRARPEARHRDEQRVDRSSIGSLHLRHQVDEPGRAGDRRLERYRARSGSRTTISRPPARTSCSAAPLPGAQRAGAVGPRVPAQPRVRGRLRGAPRTGVVKNLFELKNARRVLVEGNLFENNWVDGQPGYAIVFTPRGEGGAAPWATIEDVTFRYNIIRNVAAGFNLLARDDNGASGTMRRVRIADNLVIRRRPRRNGAATATSCRSARGPRRSSSSTTRSCRPATC